MSSSSSLLLSSRQPTLLLLAVAIFVQVLLLSISSVEGSCGFVFLPRSRVITTSTLQQPQLFQDYYYHQNHGRCCCCDDQKRRRLSRHPGFATLASSANHIGVALRSTTTTTTSTTTTSLDDWLSPSRCTFWGQERTTEEIIQYMMTSTHTNEDANNKNKNNNHDNNIPISKIAREQVQVLSASPPIVVIHNLLTPQQCHAIIQGAKEKQLQPSTTYMATATPTTITTDDMDDIDDDDNKNAASVAAVPDDQDMVTSNIRTSSTVWLRDDDNNNYNSDNMDDDDQHHPQDHDNETTTTFLSHTLRCIADYAAHMSGLPPHYMENLQVVRYRPGQEFQLHTDHLTSFNDLEYCPAGGRLATCLFYLQSPIAGGETHFPHIINNNNDTDDDTNIGIEEESSPPPQAPLFEPSLSSLHVPPTCGSALFFWNTLEKPGCTNYHERMFLQVDDRLEHAGLPVLQGEKWICNRWIHPMDYGAGVRGN